MIAFPNCKINLGLTVKAKRNDGYHDLETVFYPVGITDVLEIIPIPGNPISPVQPAVELSASGLTISGDKNDNLCVRAYHLLKKDFDNLPPVSMHLHKAIPMGAGLGGGSSNGAFALQLINEIFALHLTDAQLVNYASQLGSDCPFFIINKPCLATQRGELLTKIDLDLSSFFIVLVNPGIHINTGWAFSQLRLNGKWQSNERPGDLDAILRQPVSSWNQTLFNDFEEPVFASFPEIKDIKEDLYLRGALYASMTGSGSTVFGLFARGPLPSFQYPDGYNVMVF